MIILPFIPILALIVQTSLTLQEILEYRADVADIETQVSQQVNKQTEREGEVDRRKGASLQA